MSRFRISSVLFVVALLLAASPAVAEDNKDIIGVWEPVEVESEGKTLPDEAIKKTQVLLTFKITKDKIATPLDDDDTEISYTINPNANPKEIDTVDLNGDAKGTTN